MIFVVLVTWTQVSYAHAPRYTVAEQEVLAVTQAWGTAVNAHNADAVVALYDPHAYFFPTFATHILTYRGLHDYFVHTFAHTQELNVTFIAQFPRTDRNFGMNSGLYLVTYRKKNEWIELPAHFMFIYWKKNGKWMILEQRTLLIPEAEKVIAAS
jgi:hypothetical protein